MAPLVENKYVAPPGVLPLPFGIFSVADFVGDPDAHWQLGVEWQPYTCGRAAVLPDWECTGPGAATNLNQPLKTYASIAALVDANPFTVYGSFKCSVLGHWDDGQQRSRMHLATGAERAVELAVYSGTHQAQRLVAGTDITPTPGTPVTEAQGIALLEQYIAVNGNGQGVIWMSRRDATLGFAQRAIVEPRSGDTVLRTGLNTPVIAAGGFDGRTGPAATGAGQAWIFATGRPQIRRSDAFDTPPNRDQALSQYNNDLEFLTEQTYVVGWDCFTAAVLVTSV